MKTALAVCMALLCSVGYAQNRQVNPEAKQFRYSTTIEKERPELNEATKACIAAYRRDPSAENYAALQRQVEANYDAVIARKQAKLEGNNSDNRPNRHISCGTIKWLCSLKLNSY